MYFVTSNKNKFEEVRSILPDIKQLDIDLMEIQNIDSKEVVKQKLLQALEYVDEEVIVEDTSLSLECLNGLPGPFVKWFQNDLLVEISEKLGESNAEVKTIIGYAKNKEEMYFFEGSTKGTIVKPKGKLNFGWDPIFMPEGYNLTFAEMEDKNEVSMRRIALNKLKDFLYKI
ncbi:MAG: non-canonical purine NTP pyrophosphatase [Candidatus Pacebacteria bacterium]|nr:non-canonical purine NTP pyrophosphatase [Candidatus Paceibacterota bacterium]MDD5012804.1 non-canonical purine NTP pyrophosphatase [Candidatus Paceibacterota bacterium]MDD5752544.1 non-canonical purine NTP pyrophosphatase [Candidatus Paceibacterota bacterium]